MSMPKNITIIFSLIINSQAYALCDQSYEKMRDYYEKKRKLQLQIIQEIKDKADSIIAVRVVDVEYGDHDKDIIVESIKMKVLETYKGKYSVGEVLLKKIYRNKIIETVVCDEPNEGEERQVSELRPGFKFLVYLENDTILRANEFEEWPYKIEPEEEIHLIN